MKAKIGLAGIVFSTALFAAAFSRRSTAVPPPWAPPAPSKLPPAPPPATTPQPPQPQPSNVPTTPSVPTEQPRPRATPKTVKIQALHRYEVVADVLPVDGVSLRSAAMKILDSLRLDDPSLERSPTTVDRPGVGEVTRVTFRVNSLIDNEFSLDRQLSTAGVGSVWVVSIKDVTR